MKNFKYFRYIQNLNLKYLSNERGMKRVNLEEACWGEINLTDDGYW
jgi:hypothetical protein